MKAIYIAFFALLFQGQVFAQTADAEVRDPKAKVILDKLAAAHKSTQAIRIQFSFRLENKDQKIDETQKGSILFKGNAFKIDMDKLQIVSNGKSRWTFLKAAKEVQIDHANHSEMGEALEPSKIFTMHEKNHKYKHVGTEKIGNITYDVIKLFPEEVDKKSFHTVILYIDKAKSSLFKAKILSKDGNVYTYTLTKKETGIVTKDADFIFDTKKASEVIDLRE